MRAPSIEAFVERQKKKKKKEEEFDEKDAGAWLAWGSFAAGVAQPPPPPRLNASSVGIQRCIIGFAALIPRAAWRHLANLNWAPQTIDGRVLVGPTSRHQFFSSDTN